MFPLRRIGACICIFLAAGGTPPGLHSWTKYVVKLYTQVDNVMPVSIQPCSERDLCPWPIALYNILLT